jgi:acetyl-CoA synthetase
VVVVQRRPGSVGDEAFATMREGRDHWWHRLMADAKAKCEPAKMDAEDVLYILYTSGTTGKPKGIVHTTGGYLVGCATTTKIVFDLKEEDVFWCTADIGWVTGHSYVVYGPLANGATVLMYEGAPDWPEKDRFWDLCERYGVTILYTAPTAIRAFMKWGDQWPAKHDLSRLRLLGSVGEPINPEAWMWYQEHIGGGRCPIVDTWWQTETGAIAISPLPGITETKPGSATIPVPGFTAELLDAKGDVIPVGGGLLALTKPWPSMLRTMEVESALVEHPAVAEAAVVGRTHDLKGQALAAFVTLREGFKHSHDLREELRNFVAEKIGAIARPDDILFSADLPKTRSGKIMRRLLRDIAEGRALGDTTTLADPNVVASLKEQYEERE